MKAPITFMLSLLLVSPAAFVAETLFYRYIGNKGVTVISSKIPAKYVAKGYDVITYDGRLIERIPPEPSPEEKSRLIKEAKEKARLKAWDEDLLRRFSSPADIEAAKQRKLIQLNHDLGIISRNAEKINQEIDRYQALAADDERAGREVSQTVLDNIELLKKDRKTEQLKREEKLKEQQEITEKFEHDIERFKVIRPGSVNR